MKKRQSKGSGLGRIGGIGGDLEGVEEYFVPKSESVFSIRPPPGLRKEKKN